MPNDLMLRCEQRRDYKVNDGYERRWKEVPVSEAVGAQPSDIRCMHCHGAVRIHQQTVEEMSRSAAEATALAAATDKGKVARPAAALGEEQHA